MLSALVCITRGAKIPFGSDLRGAFGFLAGRDSTAAFGLVGALLSLTSFATGIGVAREAPVFGREANGGARSGSAEAKPYAG